MSSWMQQHLLIGKTLSFGAATFRTPHHFFFNNSSCHKDRVLIADPYTRSLLQRYAKEQPPLTMLEFTKMVELLGFHSQPLQNLVKSFGNSACPPPYVPFLKSLALDSPICGMLHPSKNLRQTLIEMREKDPKTSPKLLEDHFNFALWLDIEFLFLLFHTGF